MPPNIEKAEFDEPRDREGFRVRRALVGRQAGAVKLGASLWELPPGEAAYPYHFHLGEEEMVVVLSGTPTLRTPQGTRTLSPGDVVAFPAGPDGAHRVSNADAEPARVLLISEMNFPEIAEHVDTGTMLAMTGPAAGRVFPHGSDIDVMDALLKAMVLGAEKDEAAP